MEDTFDLNLLPLFQCIYKERSVTNAAKRLNMSQPAVSQGLARLRDSFGDPLFVRTKEGMQPTLRAAELKAAIDDGLDTIYGALRALPGGPETCHRVFNLLMPEFADVVYLPALISRIRKNAPNFRLRLQRFSQSTFADALEMNIADLAIGSVSNPRPTLRRRLVLKESVVWIARRTHPVFQQPLSITSILKTPHLVISSNEAQRDVMSDQLEAHGYIRDIAVSIASYSSVPLIISQSDLIALVPKGLLSGLPEKDLLQIIPIPAPLTFPDFEIFLFWHERQHRDPINQWIRELLANFALNLEVNAGGSEEDGTPCHCSPRLDALAS